MDIFFVKYLLINTVVQMRAYSGLFCVLASLGRRLSKQQGAQTVGQSMMPLIHLVSLCVYMVL